MSSGSSSTFSWKVLQELNKCKRNTHKYTSFAHEFIVQLNCSCDTVHHFTLLSTCTTALQNNYRTADSQSDCLHCIGCHVGKSIHSKFSIQIMLNAHIERRMQTPSII